MPLIIDLATNSAGNEPSPAIWDRVPWSDMWKGKLKHFYEDFKNFGVAIAESSNVATYAGDAGLWLSYEDTGDVPTQLATDDNGVLNIAIAATNNNETWLQPGSATTVLVTPKTRANGGQSIFFEGRVNMSTLVGNMFLGLTEEGTAAADTIADANGTLADKDYIGFLVDEDAPTVARFVYKKAGQTAQDVITSAHTFVADEFVKLGFVVDMDEWDNAKRIKVYVNGVEQGTYVTNAAYEAATFPTGEELNVLFGGKNNNAAKVVRADWIRVAQLKSGN